MHVVAVVRPAGRLPGSVLTWALAWGLVGCSESPTAPPTIPATATSAQVESTPPIPPASRQIAVQRGQAIAAETFGLLSSNLLGAIQSGGISNALPFCSLAASPLTAGMATRHGVTLKRVTHKPRNPADRATPEELGIIHTFQTLLANPTTAGTNAPPPPIVTNLVPGQASFFAPILLAKELCLKCHGDPAKDITSTDLAVIRRLYPTDEATGFRLGELRGAWRIDFPLSSLAPSP